MGGVEEFVELGLIGDMLWVVVMGVGVVGCGWGGGVMWWEGVGGGGWGRGKGESEYMESHLYT